LIKDIICFHHGIENDCASLALWENFYAIKE